MKGYKIVIFGNSIFDSKGAVRKVDYQIQQYDISFKRCRYCNGYEVKEKYFIEQEFINSSKYLYIDLIQLSYPSSPRGKHSIIVDKNDYYNSGMNSNLPNTYKGWGSYPANLYIPIENKIIAIDELEKVQVIAIRNDVNTENIKHYIGEISGGQSGNWKFFTNLDFERKKIEPILFGHKNCIKKRKFSELDEFDLYMGINKNYFRKINNPDTESKLKEIYITDDYSQVLYEYEIYPTYKMDNGMIYFRNNDQKMIIVKNSEIEEIEEY